MIGELLIHHEADHAPTRTAENSNPLWCTNGSVVNWRHAIRVMIVRHADLTDPGGRWRWSMTKRSAEPAGRMAQAHWYRHDIDRGAAEGHGTQARLSWVADGSGATAVANGCSGCRRAQVCARHRVPAHARHGRSPSLPGRALDLRGGPRLHGCGTLSDFPRTCRSAGAISRVRIMLAWSTYDRGPEVVQRKPTNPHPKSKNHRTRHGCEQGG